MLSFADDVRIISQRFGRKKARFFALKYLQFLPYSRRWLTFIQSFYAYYMGSEPPIEMIRTKFMRTYFSRRLSVRQRLHHLLSHFEVLETHLNAGAIASLCGNDSLILCTLTGKSGTQYVFTLSQHDRYRAEGELTLFMRRKGEELALAALTFSFGETAHHAVSMRIGGLQGPQAEDAKQQIIDVTRDLHGLRPKSAVLDAFYVIARIFGVAEIQAVGTQNHPLHNQRHAFRANNDLFWEEMGASKTPEGDYALPQRLSQKTLDEVAGKRRKDWLARQEHKAEIYRQMAPLITGWLKYSTHIQAADEPSGALVAAE
ncbi:MAG: DUF535 family protein [Asticcacaulis sp.]